MNVGDMITIPEPPLEVLAVIDRDDDLWTRVPGGWLGPETRDDPLPWERVATYAPLHVSKMTEPITVTQALAARALDVHSRADNETLADDMQEALIFALKELGIHVVAE